MTPIESAGSPASQAGFTITELMVASAVLMTVTGAVFTLMEGARSTFQAQLEVSDMQQRLRVGVDALAKDLLMAGAGAYTGTWTGPLSDYVAPVMPYRVGVRDSDPMAGIFYRPDAISILYVPESGPEIATHTYYLHSDSATGMFQLRHYDGSATDLPVVDHVVKLAFEYFGDGGVTLDPSILQDGPWVPDDSRGISFDADLLRIRRVRVNLRVQAAMSALRGPAGALFTHGGTSRSAARLVPDHEIRFDVAPRNLNLDR